MKMSDVFKGKLDYICGGQGSCVVYGDNDGNNVLCDDYGEPSECATYAINNHDSLVAFIRKVAKEQDGTLLGNEASQVLAGMGELR